MNSSKKWLSLALFLFVITSNTYAVSFYVSIISPDEFLKCQNEEKNSDGKLINYLINSRKNKISENFTKNQSDTFNILTYLETHFPSSNKQVYGERSETHNNGNGLIENKYTIYSLRGTRYFFEIIQNEVQDTIGYNIFGSFIYVGSGYEHSFGKIKFDPHYISKDGKQKINGLFLLKEPFDHNNYVFFEPEFLDKKYTDIDPQFSQYNSSYFDNGSFAYKYSKFKFYRKVNESLTFLFEFDNSERPKEFEVYDFNQIYLNESLIDTVNISSQFYFTFTCPRIKTDNKGIIDSKGKILFEAQFKNISHLETKKNIDFFLVDKFHYDFKNQSLYGIIKSNGQFMFNPVFEELNLSEEEGSLGVVKYNGKYGFIDYNYNIHTDTKYFDYKILNSKYALVQKGIYDNFGNEVYHNRYWTFLELNNKTESNIKIKEILKDEIDQFDLFRIKIDNKWGFANKLGKIIITPKYNSVTNFHDDVSFVTVDIFEPSVRRRYYNYHIINNTGAVVAIIPPSIGNDIREVSYFSEGLMKFKSGTNDKYGYLNKKGQIQIPPQFEECSDFFNGKASAIMYGIEFFINMKGQRLDD